MNCKVHVLFLKQMMRIIACLLICIVTANSLYGQQYSGTVFSKNTSAVLPYVNIGIVGKGVGTVSLGNGSFYIPLDAMYDSDTLRFSMIGYTSVSFVVGEYKKLFAQTGAEIFLEEAVKELETVVIKPLQLISIIKGNTYDEKSFAAGWKSDDLGSELGTIINLKKDVVYFVKNVQVNIAWCKYDSILFRLNIYDFRNGKPTELLQSLPVYLQIKKDQRYLYVDLEKFNITVENDFLIALEWLDDLPDKSQSLMFCAGLFGASTCYRKTSQDVWNKIPIGLGISVELEYEKK